MLQRHSHVLNRIQTINVSIDGATADTYEQLRRGGKWQLLLNNLEFLSQYQDQFEIKFHMVVQASNWHEMPLMLKLADQYGAHQVIFNRITNWNTFDNFEQQQVPEQLDKFKTVFAQVQQHPKSVTWQLV